MSTPLPTARKPEKSIRPARSSTLRCFETAWTLIGKGSASSVTVASPSARRATIAPRVGSARASKVLLSLASVPLVHLLGL
jgi:hypothetical protein